MSDPKNYHGSIETHDLFLTPYDERHPLFNFSQAGGITLVQSVTETLEKEKDEGYDLLIVFVKTDETGRLTDIKKFPLFKTGELTYDRLITWTKFNNVLRIIPTNHYEYDKNIGQLLLYSFLDWDVRPFLREKYEHNALCYIYKGYAGLICPYQTGPEGYAILDFSKIVGISKEALTQ